MPDEVDGSSESLTPMEEATLVLRLRTAWNNLPPDAQAAIKPMLNGAHEQLQSYLDGGTTPEHDTQQTLRMKSYILGDWDQHLERLDGLMGRPAALPLGQPLAAAPVAERALMLSVSSDGEIVGFGKYQKLDPRWELIAGSVWLENFGRKHPFPIGSPAVKQMENKVRIVLVSDFGTGNFGAGDSPSTKISKFIPSLTADYHIHLGDVYYAGQSGEENNNFLNTWPKAPKGNFTLNSNHEMYSGGGPYFNQAVGGPIFNQSQSPWSFFSIENDNWIVVGLDSAYFSDAATLYLNGTLGAGNPQIQFLTDIAVRATQSNKRVIVLTHHNGVLISGDIQGNQPGGQPLPLYKDVIGAFAGQNPPAYWYFGHSHIGVAYAPLAGSGTLCRCLGHGALPWGFASDLAAAKAAGKVQWFEDRNAGDSDNRLRVFNGFVVLDLDGANLTESYYDEDGKVAWTA